MDIYPSAHLSIVTRMMMNPLVAMKVLQIIASKVVKYA